MNPLGTIAGLFFGALAGACLAYFLPHYDTRNTQILVGIGIVLAGWVVTRFFESDSITVLCYIGGLLIGYFGFGFFASTFPGFAPVARPMAPPNLP